MKSAPTRSAPDMTIADAAGYLNVSNGHIRNLIADGSLPASRVGRLIRLRRSDIDAVIEREFAASQTAERKAARKAAARTAARKAAAKAAAEAAAREAAASKLCERCGQMKLGREFGPNEEICRLCAAEDAWTRHHDRSEAAPDEEAVAVGGG